MGKFIIDDHSGLDKDFGLYNHVISMQVDYDDVQHAEVDAAALYVQKILKLVLNWLVVMAQGCEPQPSR